MNVSVRQPHRHRDKPVVTKGEGSGGGKESDFGISRYKPGHTGQINNRLLLYSTENYRQHPAINHDEKEYMCN